MLHYVGLKAFYGKKARLKNEMTKRHHENYVQTEDTKQVGDCNSYEHKVCFLYHVAA